MITYRIFIFISISILLILISCASLIKGGKEEIFIVSEPVENAKITIFDMNKKYVVKKGKTPIRIQLKTGAGYFKSAFYKVTIEADGYKKKEILLDTTHRLLGWYGCGNACFGVFGLIGWIIVDPATGAMWTLDLKTKLKNKKVLRATLQKQAYYNPKTKTLRIVLLNQLSDEAINHIVPMN